MMFYSVLIHNIVHEPLNEVLYGEVQVLGCGSSWAEVEMLKKKWEMESGVMKWKIEFVIPSKSAEWGDVWLEVWEDGGSVAVSVVIILWIHNI